MNTVWHALDRELARLRPHREPLSLAVDALVVAAAWNFTYLFRLGFERWLTARPSYDGWVLLGIVGVYLVVFKLCRIPSGMWRFSGFGEVRRLTFACAAAGTLSAAAVLLAGLVQVPRAVLALHPLVALMGLCMVRLGYRMLYEHARAQITGGQGEVRRAIVMGAGEAARLLLAGIHQQGWTVLGLLDDDPDKRGARIGDARVLGTLADIRRPEVRGVATHAIVAMPGASVKQRRLAIELARRAGLRVLTVPRVDELREGRSAVERLRDIEPDDLLGRDPVVLDEAGIGQMIEGRTVLITGAGGSIGAELCRQVKRWRPARLVLFEMNEFNLYRIEQELGGQGVELVPLIGDVKQPEALRAALHQWQPQIVFHAAAYKHVPLMERHNAFEALRNNALGTWAAARACGEAGVERFVLISTDKAVNPTNVMGASKRAAEMAIPTLAADYPRTRFMAVRFGNVLGSSGSVIPKFKEQIARGGPVTVTHPDIIRYFMTMREAARLVIQAAVVGRTGQVYALDMGEPVKIVDLARELMRLAGHRDGEIEIVYSGLRPGEKLFEELLADGEATLPTEVPRLLIARIAPASPAVHALLEWAGSRAAAGDNEVQAQLRLVIPEYRDNREPPVTAA